MIVATGTTKGKRMPEQYRNRKEQIDDEIRRALRGLGIRGRRRQQLIDDLRALAMIGGCAERDRTFAILRADTSRHESAPSTLHRIYNEIISVSIEGVWELE
jgi:hypothetical protein